MLVRGIGIRDISVIEQVSIKKVLSVLVRSHHAIKPKQTHYNTLEIDEFWTYVGNKKKKVWLIYAYHRATGEIVSYVWGKHNYKTTKRLRDKLKSQGISYDTVYTDKWDSFIAVFKADNHIVDNENTKGIEGNNCRLRHRIRRAFRKTCCFTKKLFNRLKAFNLALFYIIRALYNSAYFLQHLRKLYLCLLEYSSPLPSPLPLPVVICFQNCIFAYWNTAFRFRTGIPRTL